MRTPLVAALLLAAGLAGCISAQDPFSQQAVAQPELEDALALLEKGAPAANVQLLGEWRQGGAQEVATWGDHLFVDRGNTVHILDVRDPSDPQEVGRVEGIPRVLDVKVSDDGDYLFIGDDQRASGILGGTGPLTGGIYVVDVRDKTAPRIVSYQPVGEERGPHMVFYHRMTDGTELVLGANADVSVHRFDRDTQTLAELSRYRPDILLEFNRDPQVVDVLYQGWAHDMFAMNEPDGRTFMYVANWDAGLRIVDITDPTRPQEVGGWNDFPDGHAGNLHTVATEWIGDKRITVGSVEVGFAVVGGYHYAMGSEPSILYVWDTTDPAHIVLLASWENPQGIKAGRDYFPDEEITSTHNLQIEQGRVYLAHYALGVWVLDVSTPDAQRAPKVLGYYQEPGMNTWDVVLHRGVIYTSGAEGVLGLHFVTDLLGPNGITSRA